MSQGKDLTGVEEFVLRRVHKNHCSQSGPLRILPVAFRPTPDDTTGISIYRAGETSPEEIVAASRKPPNEYCVVRLPVEALRAMGLTIVPEPDPDMPTGHAVIPELSLQEYTRTPQRLKEVQEKLARLASDNIVLPFLEGPPPAKSG
jgi:hypothetical protein